MYYSLITVDKTYWKTIKTEGGDLKVLALNYFPIIECHCGQCVLQTVHCAKLMLVYASTSKKDKNKNSKAQHLLKLDWFQKLFPMKFKSFWCSSLIIISRVTIATFPVGLGHFQTSCYTNTGFILRKSGYRTLKNQNLVTVKIQRLLSENTCACF